MNLVADVREFVARLEETSDAMDRDFANGGWVVVVIDGDRPDDLRRVVSWADGPYDQPEQALARAAELDAEDKRASRGEDDKWIHAVVPLRRPPTKGERWAHSG